jgi:hypothetical protein
MLASRICRLRVRARFGCVRRLETVRCDRLRSAVSARDRDDGARISAGASALEYNAIPVDAAARLTSAGNLDVRGTGRFSSGVDADDHGHDAAKCHAAAHLARSNRPKSAKPVPDSHIRYACIPWRLGHCRHSSMDQQRGVPGIYIASGKWLCCVPACGCMSGSGWFVRALANSEGLSESLPASVRISGALLAGRTRSASSGCPDWMGIWDLLCRMLRSNARHYVRCRYD